MKTTGTTRPRSPQEGAEKDGRYNFCNGLITPASGGDALNECRINGTTPDGKPYSIAIGAEMLNNILTTAEQGYYNSLLIYAPSKRGQVYELAQVDKIKKTMAGEEISDEEAAKNIEYICTR